MLLALNLRNVGSELREQAIDAVAERDAFGFVLSAKSNQCALALVFDNSAALLNAGIYEVCLLQAFSGVRTNHHLWSDDAIAHLFGLADRRKLREAGDPLASDGPFRIYRGISGRGRNRRLRGFSWTESLDIACWFAIRFDQAFPAVLVADVQADDVLAFYNGRNESEFIVRPTEFKRCKLSQSEIQARANGWQQSRDSRITEQLITILEARALSGD